jgi:hypothetical protein
MKYTIDQMVENIMLLDPTLDREVGKKHVTETMKDLTTEYHYQPLKPKEN